MVWAFHFQNGPWVFTLDKHSFKYITNLNSCMWTCFNEEKTPLITKEKQKKGKNVTTHAHHWALGL